MTVQVKDNGDFVENIHSELKSNPVSASYEILSKSETSVSTLAHGLRRSLGIDYDSDADLTKWCKAVTSVQVADEGSNDDGSLARMFCQSTDFTADAFTKLPEDSKYGAIATSELRDTEYANQHQKLVDGGVIDSDQTVLVPQTKSGEIVPIVVMKNDVDGSVPTFEGAKEILDEFVSDYFGEVEVTEEANMEDESDDESTDSGSDSDDGEDLHWLRDVDGVGPDVFGNISDHMVENHTSVHHGEFQDVEAIREAPTLVSESEAKKRLRSVAADMPQGSFDVATDMISEGETGKAIQMIEDYESDDDE